MTKTKLDKVRELTAMVSDPRQWIQNESVERIALELRCILESQDDDPETVRVLGQLGKAVAARDIEIQRLTTELKDTRAGLAACNQVLQQERRAHEASRPASSSMDLPRGLRQVEALIERLSHLRHGLLAAAATLDSSAVEPDAPLPSDFT